MGLINLLLWGAGVVLVIVGVHPGTRPMGALPGPQGAGRQRRPLRGVAGRLRGDDDRTGASVAMDILRRQARIGRPHRRGRRRPDLLRLPHPLSGSPGRGGGGAADGHRADGSRS